VNKLTVVVIGSVLVVVGSGVLVGCKGGARTNDSGPSLAAESRGTTDLGPTARVDAGADENRVVARITGRSITEKELRDPLVEAYGLPLLLNLVQLELATREAERLGIVVTDADVEVERQRWVDKMFEKSNAARLDKINETRAKDPAEADRMLAALRAENDKAFDQLLVQERMSRPEFNVVIRTTATLTKIAEPRVREKVADDQLVHDSFRIQYGEKVVVRHIQTNNMGDLNAARRRLAAGEPFEQVAREMSTNRVTGPLGGEVQAFSRNSSTIPQAFRDAAFALKDVGDVSEAVQADGAYHLIKLDQRIDPTVVKFEDVKESVRQDLYDKLMQASIRNLRGQLGQDAIAGLTIDDPILGKQFREKLEQQQGKVRDREAVREELNRQREEIVAQQAEELAASTRPSVTTRATTTTTSTTSTSTTSTAPKTTTTTGSTTRAARPTSTFVDDLFPSTLPAPMKSAMPENMPPPATQNPK
jgi:parvulin-like peptidyl-prolyl isomerase